MAMTPEERDRWRMDILGSAADDALSDEQFHLRRTYQLIEYFLNREHERAVRAVEHIRATNEADPFVRTECEARLAEIQLAHDAIEAGMLGLRHPAVDYLDAARRASGSKNPSRLQCQQIATMAAFNDVVQARLPKKCPSERAAV